MAARAALEAVPVGEALAVVVLAAVAASGADPVVLVGRALGVALARPVAARKPRSRSMP